jgi:RHS repeat-associated protein
MISNPLSLFNNYGKFYQLSQQLGNFNYTWFTDSGNPSGMNPDEMIIKSGVLNVVTDRKLAMSDGANSPKVAFYTADVVSYSDYFPFGMQMPGRHGAEGDYRYGFQGQEKDDEVKGEGNSVNYKYRMHDPRIGRFFAVDPLAPKYPWYTPYQFSGNKVINCVELEGLEEQNVVDVNGSIIGKVTGPRSESYSNEFASSIGGYIETPGGTEPVVGTNPFEEISNGAFFLSYNHQHKEVIDLLFINSGGGDLYNKHNPGGTHKVLDGDLKGYLETMKSEPSGVEHNEYTNANRGFFVSDNTYASESSFVNWMLGNMISGTGSENFIFSQNSTFTDYVRNSLVVKSAMDEFTASGSPNTFQTKGSYGAFNQISNVVEFGTLLTVENFMGSANVFFKKISSTEVLVTVINITSLTSGDLDKHLPQHQSVGWPKSTVRGTGDKYYPIPYANISQVFQFVIPIF